MIIPVDALLESGYELTKKFCLLNNVPVPSLKIYKREEWQFSVCAYYRKSTIHICPGRCATIGTAGRQWSYPGYSVDRTPYGVIQHELGHHIDVIRGNHPQAYYSEYSDSVRNRCLEKPITSYCPNSCEWFAEMFRLFVTNPDLLKCIRPLTHVCLLNDGLKPVFTDRWFHRIEGAPARTHIACNRKIRELENGLRNPDLLTLPAAHKEEVER